MNALPALLQADTDPFQLISDFLGSPLLRLFFQLMGLFIVVLWLSLVYWTYVDASRRGAVKIYWGLIALIFPFVGTLVYLIVRPPEYLLDSRERELELAVLERELRHQIQVCPSCRAMVERDYLLCPECGRQLKKACISCSRPINLDWEVCPYCAREQRGRGTRRVELDNRSYEKE
jgi:RNA polymerase subunit RPABC4/transcription elongation factor Spt4